MNLKLRADPEFFKMGDQTLHTHASCLFNTYVHSICSMRGNNVAHDILFLTIIGKK